MPQLAGSVIVLVHVMKHIMLGSMQLAPQMPFVQVLGKVHTLPHVPQLDGSLCVLTQTLLHAVWPAEHGWHMKFEQIDVEPHGVAQFPQCVGSDWTFTQIPLQRACPAGHCGPHIPLVHVWPAPQTVLHVPQWLGSDDRL